MDGYLYMYMYIYIYVYVYACIYIYMSQLVELHCLMWVGAVSAGGGVPQPPLIRGTVG